MAESVIEYARFREVQERRARMRMVEEFEPTQAPDPPATKTVADVAVSRVDQSATKENRRER
jgi:hypothetical protein